MKKKKPNPSCYGHTGKLKIRFPDEHQAYAWIKLNNHKDMKVYRCPDCKGVHIAHGRK